MGVSPSLSGGEIQRVTHLGPVDDVTVHKVVGRVQPILFAIFVIVSVLLVPKHQRRHVVRVWRVCLLKDGTGFHFQNQQLTYLQMDDGKQSW